MRVEEYLAQLFRPDCDFVEGQLENGHVGLRDHSALQNAVQVWFWQRRKQLQVRATLDGHMEARDGILRTADGAVAMPLAEVFAIVNEE